MFGLLAIVDHEGDFTTTSDATDSLRLNHDGLGNLHSDGAEARDNSLAVHSLCSWLPPASCLRQRVPPPSR